MKKLKRIISVFLLVLTVTVVGYLVYTGSRLGAVQNVEYTQMEASYAQKEDI